MKLRKTRITSTGQPEFEHFWHIYNESFPEIERKNLNGIKIALSKDKFHNELVFSENNPVAILSYWLYPGFCYLEYIAINPSEKGNGLGTNILGSLLEEVSQPVILEIEHIVDETTRRRLNFYQRMGFIPNPQHNHMQPPYQQGFELLPMLLMTYPAEISESEYLEFYKLLTTEIVEI